MPPISIEGIEKEALGSRSEVTGAVGAAGIADGAFTFEAATKAGFIVPECLIGANLVGLGAEEAAMLRGGRRREPSVEVRAGLGTGADLRDKKEKLLVKVKRVKPPDSRLNEFKTVWSRL